MGKTKVEALVDYWEFTVPYDSMNDCLALIPCGVEVLRNKRGDYVGWRGYTRSGFVAQSEGRVGWAPDDQRMGFHVSLGSRALKTLAALDGRWKDLPAVMAYVLGDLGGHSTRVDVAFDDFAGLVTMDAVGSALRDRRYVSRSRKWKYYQSAEPTKKNGLVIGETYYLGSGKSDTQLRIYDKRAERLQKGKDVDADHWTRCELQFRRKRADAAGRLFSTVKDNCQAVMVKFAGILRSHVEFKDVSWDTNRARWPVARWWARFLGFAEKARLAVVQAEAKTLEDVRSWFACQVAPSVAMLEEGMGFDEAWAFVFAEVQEGRQRWGPRHRAILSASVA